MTNQIEELKEKIATMQHNLKVLENLEAQKTDVEKAYRDAYGRYPETSGFAMSDWDAISWEAFQFGWEAAQPKPMNEVLDRLENKYKDAEENAASYMTDEVVNRMLKKWEENPPDFLKFELGKTLEGLIEDWWINHLDMEQSDEEIVDSLVSMISNWLPKEQSHEGTQSVSVIDLVDGYNDALTKIKSKLRNKK